MVVVEQKWPMVALVVALLLLLVMTMLVVQATRKYKNNLDKRLQFLERWFVTFFNTLIEGQLTQMPMDR